MASAKQDEKAARAVVYATHQPMRLSGAKSNANAFVDDSRLLGRENKQALLEQLSQHTYCRLARSSIHGVGVVAVRDIPAGTHPFRSSFRRPFPIVDLTPDEVAQLPEHSRSLVRDFFLPDSDGIFSVTDPSVMDISFFLNDGKTPETSNMKCCDCIDGCGYDDLVATRDIRAGEELLLHYGDAATYEQDNNNESERLVKQLVSPIVLK